MSQSLNRPRYTVFTVKTVEGQKPRYINIGAAFAIKDGTALSLKLDALPLNGQLLLFPPKTDESSKNAKN